MLEVVREVRLIEELLGPHSAALGSTFRGYRAHAYRMFNFARALAADPRPDADDRIAIVAVLHDLPVVLDGDLEYVERGGALAADHAAAIGKPEWGEELRLMAENHHKIRPYAGPHQGLVEATRRADWIDASFTRLRFGLPGCYVQEVARAFPMSDLYPWPAARLMVRYAVRHPRRPLPMLRW